MSRTYSEPFRRFISMVRGNQYLILDTETSGLEGEIIEIAVIDSNGQTYMNTLVKPSASCRIHPKARAIHGISHDMLRDQPTWREVRPVLLDALRGRNVVIYNASFDVARIKTTDTANGFAPTAYNTRATWCAMTHTAEYVGNWNDYHQSYRWVQLSDAATMFGVKIQHAHRALGDCLTTLGVVNYIAKSVSANKTQEQSQ